MYISILELEEDDGEYTCHFYKNRDEFKGPYVTVYELKNENRITVWYKGEEIYSRSMDERYDDGFDIHIMPPHLTVEDLKYVKKKLDTFWVRRNK